MKDVLKAFCDGVKRERAIDLLPRIKRYIVNAADFGVPQDRRRVVVYIPPNGCSLPPPINGAGPLRTLRDAIGPDSGFIDPDPEFRALTQNERKLNGQLLPGEKDADGESAQPEAEGVKGA